MVLDRLAAVPGLSELRALARRRGGGLWLVGGAVRDVLLGAPVRDLDVAVEGDALALARELGTVVAEHERFGTAEVEIAGAKVNLAATRTETYSRPGALPDVTLGATIEQDLRRRDFTVNAIAVALDDGREAAVAGARDDIAQRTLRVLHDASFVDDATRILRMVRYRHRLDLMLEPHTADLARAAVADRALHALTRDRIAAELRLMLHEPDPVAALADAHAWVGSAAPAVEPGLAYEALDLLPPEGRRDVVLVASGAIARGLAQGDATRVVRDATRDIQWFDDSRPTRRRAELAAQAPQLAARLREASRPSQIAAAVRGQPLEAIALAGGLGAREPAQRWLTQLRHVSLTIDGRDVMAAGVQEGPQVRAALERALARRLDGEIAPGRDAELRAALGGEHH
jgi:tRNA nucleotidyltransferase (CCA-adding enzyme)